MAMAALTAAAIPALGALIGAKLGSKRKSSPPMYGGGIHISHRNRRGSGIITRIINAAMKKKQGKGVYSGYGRRRRMRFRRRRSYRRR